MKVTSDAATNLVGRWHLASMAAVLAATALFMGVCGAQGRGLYMTSGVWAGLAADFTDGVFYRPVFGEDGFGGTRYMPLFFVVHGFIWSIINHPVLAAYLVVVPAAIAVVLGVYRLLQIFGLGARAAALFGLLTMASYTFQYGLLSTRGDMLAAALNLWGLAICAAQVNKPGVRVFALGALLFALAFMTKFTTLFGLAAVVLHFAARRQWRAAIGLASAAGALIVATLVAVHVASDGRALDSFLACAAGGTTLTDFLMSPLKFLFAARVDIAFLIFVASAGIVLFVRRNPLRDLPSIAFLMTLAATIMIAASPGTDLSHHVDLQAASIVLAASGLRSGHAPRALRWAMPLGGFVGAASIVASTVWVPFALGDSRWEQQRQIMAIVGQGESPLLADDPWVPILAGESPHVLDNFALRTVSESRPEVGKDFLAKLDGQFFRAVVLYLPQHLRDAPEATNGTWRGRRWFGELFYPAGFEERLLEAYAPEAFIGEYIVLLPTR